MIIILFFSLGLHTALETAKKIMILRCLFRKTAIIATFFLAIAAAGYAASPDAKDYSRLIDFINLEDRLQPLYAFNDFDDQFDKESHRASIEYFNEHPGLLQKIREKLGRSKLRWKLASLKHRLLFVPENRKEYATLYESYCHTLINDLLEKTDLDNPYERIFTLAGDRSRINDGRHGVTAYIVHNLAKEYIGTYIFTNQTDKKVKIELEGKLYMGEVGAYSTAMKVNPDGSVQFVKSKYTIWQNSARNPYTALMVPAEETLHIKLREYTQRAIKQTLAIGDVHGPKAVQKLVNDWMAVEEAIVGGIVRVLLPRILEAHLDELPLSWIEKDLEFKAQLKQYRYLKKGIAVIRQMGYQKAIKLYAKDPAAFSDLLM
jgi:hypothetical protein